MYLVLLLYIFEGILCFALGVPKLSNNSNEIISLYLLIFNSIVSFITILFFYKNTNKNIRTVLLISLFLKVSLLLWDFYGTKIFILPNSHADSESYNFGGLLFARGVTSGIENYAYIVGYVYKFFGYQRMTAQFLNIIFSFMGIDILRIILSKLNISNEAKNKTVILACFMPNYMIFSSILIRECAISVVICFSLFFFIMYWLYNNPTHLILAVAISFGGVWFHAGCIALTIGYAMSLAITKRINSERKINLSGQTMVLAVVFFFIFSFVFTYFSNSLLSRFGGLEMNTIDTYVDEHNTETNDGSSHYKVGTEQRGPIGLIVNTPIRVFYFLWAPLPWMFRNPGDIIAFIFSGCFYGGLAFRTIYLLYKKRIFYNKALIVSVLIIGLCGAFVFAWGVESVGSCLRHREKFFFIYLTLYALLYNDNLVRKP